MANSKTYLTVPYAEKDAAKALGAKWDATKKKWYAPANTELSSFSKWKIDSTVKVNSTKTASPAKTSSGGVTTHPTDKNFVAYSGELAPWD